MQHDVGDDDKVVIKANVKAAWEAYRLHTMAVRCLSRFRDILFWVRTEKYWNLIN